MGLPPQAMIYVGDDPANDVIAPRASGLNAAWINRVGKSWPESLEVAPASAPVFTDLNAFADWMLAPMALP